MAVEQLQPQLQAMTARLQALETTLNNRNEQVREVAEAVGQAAVQGQPAPVDENGQPIDRRAERRYDTAFQAVEKTRPYAENTATWTRCDTLNSS